MNRYDFLNTKTKEYFDEIMSYEEKVQYLKDNPHIESDQLSFNECGWWSY